MEFVETRRNLGEVAARSSHLDYCIIISSRVSQREVSELLEFEKRSRREVIDN